MNISVTYVTKICHRVLEQNILLAIKYAFKSVEISSIMTMFEKMLDLMFLVI